MHGTQSLAELILRRFVRFVRPSCYIEKKKEGDIMRIDYQKLGERIQQRRRALGMRQSELAERVDISNNHLSGIETGRQKPSLDTLFAISSCLKTTPDYFLYGVSEKGPTPQALMDAIAQVPDSDKPLVGGILNLFIERSHTTPPNRGSA